MRPRTPPPPPPKEWTRPSIAAGIAKLKKRLVEVEALDPHKVSHTDPRVEGVQSNLRNTIVEVFGDGSSEAREYRFILLRHNANARTHPQQALLDGLLRAKAVVGNLIERLGERAEYIPVEEGNEPTAESQPPMSTNPRRVAVLFGRNIAARDAVFDILRALGLDPIEWARAVRETGTTSPYNAEVVAKLFVSAQAVVVLMTGDEEVRLRPELGSTAELAPRLQPRANVLLEAGMAFAHARERTIFLSVGSHSMPSDLHGLNYVVFDGSSHSRNALKSRLEVAGCAVESSGSDWLKAGQEHLEKALALGGAVAKPLATSSLTTPPREREDDVVLDLVAAAGDRGLTREALSLAKIPEQRARYRLERLEGCGWIEELSVFGDVPIFVVTPEGRRELARRGIL